MIKFYGYTSSINNKLEWRAHDIYLFTSLKKNYYFYRKQIISKNNL